MLFRSPSFSRRDRRLALERGCRQVVFFCAKTLLLLVVVLLLGLEFTRAASITMTGGTDLSTEPASTWLFMMACAGALNAAGTVSGSVGQRYAGKNEAEIAFSPRSEFQWCFCSDSSRYASGATIQRQVAKLCRRREKRALNCNNESDLAPTTPPR